MTVPMPEKTGSEGMVSLDAAVLRIYGVYGEPVGAGFLVTGELALTCAHVVTAALGIPEGSKPAASARLEADLPLLPGSGHVKVVASIEHLIPPQPSGAGDVAVLRLDAPPPGAWPIRLLETERRDVWDHPARAFGFPVGRPGGVWHSGMLRARQASGWVQADLAAEGYRVTAGFSGSPVWDDELVGVVGMMAVAEAGDPPVSYLIPTDGLLAAWPDLRAQVLPPSPFRGLSAFREPDAPVFHGRADESRQLSVTVAAGRWTTLVGPSGCGKSSLVQAGVLPRLRAQGYCPVVLRPSSGSSPLSALAAALLPLREPPGLSGTEWDERLDKLASRLATPWALADIVPDLLQRNGCHRLLVVVDQFEEIFARPAADIDALASVLFSDNLPDTVRVLATLRADFLEAVMARPCLRAAVSRPPELLWPMSTQQLREVITVPVDAVPGVRYQPNLVERILDDAGSDAGALPLLEFTLDMLWYGQRGGELTHEAYDALAGVHGALKAHADQKWEQYVDSEEYNETAARELLTKLVRVPIGSAAAMRRTVLRSELTGDEWHVAQSLAATRLLVTGRNAKNVETVEIAHEALITAWSELAARVATDRAFLEWRESLHHDMARWEREYRARDLLPSAAALEGARGREADLSRTEREYLKQGRSRRRSRARRRRHRRHPQHPGPGCCRGRRHIGTRAARCRAAGRRGALVQPGRRRTVAER